VLSGLVGLEMSVVVAASLNPRSKIDPPDGELGNEDEPVNPVWFDCIDQRAFFLGIEMEAGDKIAPADVGLDDPSIDVEDLGVEVIDVGVN
jgi:hypothetical protein